jgi:hypothetical protein
MAVAAELGAENVGGKKDRGGAKTRNGATQRRNGAIEAWRERTSY